MASIKQLLDEVIVAEKRVQAPVDAKIASATKILDEFAATAVKELGETFKTRSTLRPERTETALAYENTEGGFFKAYLVFRKRTLKRPLPGDNSVHKLNLTLSNKGIINGGMFISISSSPASDGGYVGTEYDVLTFSNPSNSNDTAMEAFRREAVKAIRAGTLKF